ncbi:MAG: hypothetical protein ABL995_02500 [Bryobacteraceae bacterium]
MRAGLVRFFITPVLIAALTAPLRSAESDPAVLELLVIEGDGFAYAVGSRATRGVTAQVTDESGRPVSGATVSFTLPSDGPGGTFASGGRNEIVTTKADGRATVWGMQWNRTPGPFEIRITAAKGQARAGILCTQYLNDARTSAAPRPSDRRAKERAELSEPEAIPRAATAPERSSEPPRVSPGGHRWLWIALGTAGLAVAGAAVINRSGSTTPASTTQTTSSVQIGTPSVTLGRP